MTDTAQEPEAVAYRYRWKIDGEWTSWHFSDASQKHPSLNSLQEQPVYTRPVSLDREAVYFAVEAANTKYWETARANSDVIDKWRAAGSVGDLPTIVQQGSIVTVMTDAILALIEGRT